MKNTTLCYIENEKGEYLMLHREIGRASCRERV